jgi:hypothetical protein
VTVVLAPDVRRVFLEAATAAVDLLADPRVAERWGDDSACSGWDVGGLAAHLARAVTQVEHYLAAADGATSGAPATRDSLTAGAYYAALPGLDDPESELSAAVRRRSAAAAAAGPHGVLDSARAALDTLRVRLPEEPAGRLVEALGMTLCLDEYLRTRLVEICVHVEDLALSIGTDVPALPDEAVRGAVDVLVDTAVHRHGLVPVLRALARRERDTVDALRLF